MKKDIFTTVAPKNMVKVGTYERYCHQDPEIFGDEYQPDHPVVFVCEQTEYLDSEEVKRGPFWLEKGSVYQ